MKIKCCVKRVFKTPDKVFFHAHTAAKDKRKDNLASLEKDAESQTLRIISSKEKEGMKVSEQRIIGRVKTWKYPERGRRKTI